MASFVQAIIKQGSNVSLPRLEFDNDLPWKLAHYHKESNPEYDDLRDGGAADLSKQLLVDVNVGVETASVKQREQVFGSGETSRTKPDPYVSYLQNALGDPTLRLLCACALLSIFIAVTADRNKELGWVDGVAILCTVAIVCNIQAVQEWSMNRDFQKHNASVNTITVTVLRDGVLVDVPKKELVVGDVISIKAGDILEADGVLIAGEGVECDETKVVAMGIREQGKNERSKRVDGDVLLFCGSVVTRGSGSYLATAVGNLSVFRTALRNQSQRLSAQEDATSSYTIVRRAFNASIRAPLFGQLFGTNMQLEKDELQVAVDDEADVSDHNTSQNAEESDSNSSFASEACSISDFEGENIGDTDTAEYPLVLDQKLRLLVETLSQYGFSAAAVTSLAMLIRYLFDRYIWKPRAINLAEDAPHFLEALVTGIALLVVAVPEGLPLAVTIASAASMRKMQVDNILVKNLDATETMGGTTSICIDKSGNLTSNVMTVVRAYVCGQDLGPPETEELDGDTYAITFSKAAIPELLRERIGHCICLTMAEDVDVQTNIKGDSTLCGNPTDCGLLAFAQGLGFDLATVRANLSNSISSDASAASRRLKLPAFGLPSIPFSESRMRNAQAVPLTSNPQGPCRLYMKGAAEVILQLCSHEIAMNGEVAMVEFPRRAQIMHAISVFASMSLRVIALAYRDFEEPPSDWTETVESRIASQSTGLLGSVYTSEEDLTLVAVLGAHDPVRPGVVESVVRCNQAGIDIRLLSGDHRESAVAFARQCGILLAGIDYQDDFACGLSHQFTAMTGEEFRQAVLAEDGQFNQNAFDDVWPYLRVLARMSPADKRMLVQGMRNSQLHTSLFKGSDLPIPAQPQVVACTGDCVYDEPVLQLANVGFSSVSRGTRFAKEGADILLMNCDLESMLKACNWGRNIRDSIAKFVQFQMTVNINAVAMTMLGAMGVRRAPLTVVQMLWVNLIMDSLAALALAAEPPCEAQMDRPPCSQERGIISFEMVLNIVGQTIFQFGIFIALLFNAAGPGRPADLEQSEPFEFKTGGWFNIESGIGRGRNEDPTQHLTMIFNAFVMMQLFNWINCRKVNHEINVFGNLRRNPVFVGIWLGCFLVQIVMVQSAALFSESGVNTLFKTRALSTHLWIVTLGSGVASLVWQWVITVTGSILKPLLWGPEKWHPRTGDVWEAKAFMMGPGHIPNDLIPSGDKPVGLSEDVTGLREMLEDPPEEKHNFPSRTVGWFPGQTVDSRVAGATCSGKESTKRVRVVG
eukprot:TRINITY_DN8529_c0_g1_i1.p1 TRINITY_DN8529_c0_g1~~TRINITY_DN8529_c0_g1_i1.p1  ORF type:complete len:1280 (-),score=209.37 TRINITY_DN8529_c0_g1_i1:84-3878(-)